MVFRQLDYLRVSFALGINHDAGPLTSRPHLGNYDAPVVTFRLPPNRIAAAHPRDA